MTYKNCFVYMQNVISIIFKMTSCNHNKNNQNTKICALTFDVETWIGRQVVDPHPQYYSNFYCSICCVGQ